MAKHKAARGVLAENRKARHDYDVLETLEAGVSLAGTEVKSIREGAVSLRDAWCKAGPDGLVLHGMHVAPYEKGNIFNKDPLRPRRLLVHKREARRLAAAQQRDGCAIVPLDLHLSNGRVKATVALCKGRKNYDKREAEARKDDRREMDRATKRMERRQTP